MQSIISKITRKINRTLIFFGAEICEYCGSPNVLQQGYEENNHRHYCQKCGMVTQVS
jgi:hypothetical protein